MKMDIYAVTNGIDVSRVSIVPALMVGPYVVIDGANTIRGHATFSISKSEWDFIFFSKKALCSRLSGDYIDCDIWKIEKKYNLKLYP